MIFSAGSNALGGAMYRAFPQDTDKRNNKHEVIVSYLPTSPDTSYMNVLLLDNSTFKNLRNKKTIALINAMIESDPRVGLVYLKMPRDKIESTIPPAVRELSNFSILNISKMDSHNLTEALEMYFKNQAGGTLDSMLESSPDQLGEMGIDSINSLGNDFDEMGEIRTGGDLQFDEPTQDGFSQELDFDLNGFDGDTKSYYTPASEEDSNAVDENSRTHVPVGVGDTSSAGFAGEEVKSKKPEKMNTTSPFAYDIPKNMGSTLQPTGLLDRLKTAEATNLSGAYLAKVTTDEIHVQLMKENAEYFTAVNYMDTLKQSLISLVANRSMPIASKIQLYQEIVGNIVTTKRNSSEMLTKKVIEVIDLGINIIEETVSRRIDTLSKTIYNMSAESSLERMQNKLGEVIKQRSQICVEINSVIEGLNAIVSNVTNLTTSTSKHLGQNNLTDSPYINEMVTPYVNFNLGQSHDFLLSLLTAVERKTIAISMVDSKLRALLTQAHSLVSIDSDIIARQGELIDHLLVTKLNQVVVSTTILQNCLSMFVGAEGSGKTVSSLIYASMMVGNTMLIDMTGKHKLANYTNVMPFEDQMVKMDRAQLLVTEADINTLDFEAAVVFLRQATVFYSNIIVLADVDTGKDVFKTFDLEIREYFCVLQHTTSQFDSAKRAIRAVSGANKAIKVVSIDPVLEPLEVFQRLDVELSLVGYVTLPHMHDIKRSTIDHVNPAYNQQIRNEFQRAFCL